MREILFRGKFRNEWKYGFLSIEPQGLVIKEQYKNNTSNVWHIESDTIGQYTGFTDKNGAKIFEGDILAFARGKFHALYIELKVGNNKATEKQRKWIKRLREQGNLALVCYGWEEASAVLLKYIKLKADSEDEKL